MVIARVTYSRGSSTENRVDICGEKGGDPPLKRCRVKHCRGVGRVWRRPWAAPCRRPRCDFGYRGVGTTVEPMAISAHQTWERFSLSDRESGAGNQAQATDARSRWAVRRRHHLFVLSAATALRPSREGHVVLREGGSCRGGCAMRGCAGCSGLGVTIIDVCISRRNSFGVSPE